MIESLTGILKFKSTNKIIIDVNGVGYGLEVPLTVLCDLPSLGSEVNLWVFTRVREDSFKLYGFLTMAERQTFDVLTQISGVGPKVALAMMSTLNTTTLRYAVENSEVDVLQLVPGIGKRTAEKIILELKVRIDKLDLHVADVELPLSEDLEKRGAGAREGVGGVNVEMANLKSDLNAALSNLGFKDKDIRKAINCSLSENSSEDFSHHLKSSLHFLREGMLPKDKKPSKLLKDNPKESRSELIDSLF